MNRESIRVLLIEDSKIIRSMVNKMLCTGGQCTFEIAECDNLTEGNERLRNESFDIVLLDLTLPESTGVETVGKVRQVDSDIPIVVFTGTDDDSLAMAAMHLGADDYLVKKEVQQGSLLSRTLRYSIEQKKTRLALNRYAVEMERLAEARARQLIHQDRLAAIGTMSAGVAHEIRGPLSFISDNTRALANQWQDVAQILETVQKNRNDREEISYILSETPDIFQDIFNGIDRIREITEGLKKFSRKGPPELTTGSIEACVENALVLCRNLTKYGVDIHRDFHTEGTLLMLEPQKIVQVFVNLFYNAVQAMENRGAITISTNILEDYVTVDIEDTGPGIPADTLDAIWEPFYTTKSEDAGTGLGLSICKEIISSHGGTISATNGAHGARFSMKLPISHSNDTFVPEA